MSLLPDAEGREVLARSILFPATPAPGQATEELCQSIVSHFLAESKELPRCFTPSTTRWAFAWRMEGMEERLVSSSPDHSLTPPHFHVFYNSNPVMAASLGRHVLLSSGVLALPRDQVSFPITSKEQLAFVVAHEMAHHHLDHHAEGISLILVPPLPSTPQLETCCLLAAAALAARGRILWR